MPDDAQPTFIGIGPKGEITYEFEGVIKALGISLRELVESEGINRIEWLNKNNVAKQVIQGRTVLSETLHTLLLEAIGSVGSGKLQLEGSDLGLNLARFVAIAGGQSVIVLNGNDESDFLQLTETKKRKTSFGQVNVTFEAGALLSNNVEISHGLGVVPQSIIATSNGAPGASDVGTANIFAPTNVKFTLNAVRPAAAAKVTYPFSWQAIG